MTPVCLSPLMRSARQQWGFEANGGCKIAMRLSICCPARPANPKGITIADVTSDSDSVADAYQAHHFVKTAAEASCEAITKGGDQIDSGGTFMKGLLAGVKQGLCSMADVDAALRVVMQMRIELGLFDPVSAQPLLKLGAADIGTKEADALNLVATQRSLVLLKDGGSDGSAENAGGGVLPLKVGASTAVIGPHYNAVSHRLCRVPCSFQSPSGANAVADRAGFWSSRTRAMSAPQAASTAFPRL